MIVINWGEMCLGEILYAEYALIAEGEGQTVLEWSELAADEQRIVSQLARKINFQLDDAQLRLYGKPNHRKDPI